MIGIIDTKSHLDPLELNRGQVVHFPAPKRLLDPIGSGVRVPKQKYNQNVEIKPSENVIFVDWFAATILLKSIDHLDAELDHIEYAEGLVLINRNRSTKIYNCMWDLIYLGEHYGTILTNPNLEYIEHNQAQLEIKNEFLYCSDWLDTYKEILELCRWRHKSTTRLDICVDGAAASAVEKLLHRHNSGRVIGVKGRARISHTYLPSKKVIGYKIGSPNSDKSATTYCKTDEIKNSGKTYIASAWQRNNLKIGDEVKRVELRMKSKITKRYDYTRLDDCNYLASILRSETKNWLEFYYKGKDKNKHRTYKNKTMEWIDWSTIKGELLPKNKAITKSGIHRAKRVIKDLHYLHYVEDKKLDKGFISDLMDVYVLDKWFTDRIDRWINEWEREKKYRSINSN